jgi:nucleoside-diphosphate-sugar epimerase
MVYGLHGSIDVDETARLEPYGDDYGDTKIEAETIVREASQRGNLETCIVRPGMVYGPQSQAWTLQLIDWGKRGILPLIDNGRGTAFPIYIENLVDLLEMCIDHPGAANSTFNAVDDGPITFNEFLGSYMSMIPTTKALRIPGSPLKMLANLLSFISPSRSLPYLVHQLMQTGQIKNDSAKTKLGWKPAVPLRDGMAQSEAWLRASGYL